MNPSVKAKWVEALRSGWYTQTDGTLKQGNSFCCLGVLCDLYLKEHKDTPSKWNPVEPDGDEFHAFDEAGCSSSTTQLPSQVRDWGGLVSSDPRVEDRNGTLRVLSVLNDDGETFDSIAGLIEAQL